MKFVADTTICARFILPLVLAGAFVSSGHAADQVGVNAYFAGGASGAWRKF